MGIFGRQAQLHRSQREGGVAMSRAVVVVGGGEVWHLAWMLGSICDVMLAHGPVVASIATLEKKGTRRAAEGSREQQRAAKREAGQ